MDSGNIGFVLLCAAFVFVMTPGLAMFYGGLVRKKNVVNTMMTSIFIIGVGIVMWVLFGYSLSFAPSGNAFIGDFRWLGLEGVSLTEGYTDDASIPNMVFSAFQMMFAVITPALITGAVAGRMKFKSIFVFTIFWSLIVYYPLAHMVWGQGGLLGADGIGALDFAGGDVIKNKKPTLIGASTGMVAGLVGITPGAGFVPMWAAVIIGLTTSPVCYIMISYGKKKFGFDDALDAFSCHGTGGIWGGLLTGVFSCTAINSSAGNGLVYGEFAQFGAQAAGIGITIVIAVVGTLICYGITRLLTGKIRVDIRDELMGLDVSQHGEAAYPSFNGLDN